MTTLNEELTKTGKDLESYLETVTSIGIVLIDPALIIQDCNQGFVRLFQLEQKPLGRLLTDFLAVAESDVVRAEELRLSCNHRAGVEGVLHCRAVQTETGHLLFCERLMMTGSRAIEQIGAINNELVNLQRETVKKNLLLKKLEDHNRRLQKAESLGRMAGAVAHHFNNELGVVMGYLEIAVTQLPEGSGLCDCLTKATKAAGKAAEMSGLMLTYLGQSFDTQAPLDLSGACRRNLPALRAMMPGEVVLEADFPPQGPVIKANGSQLRQILVNLVTNAREAIGEGRGTIRLSVTAVSAVNLRVGHHFPVDWQSQDPAYACLEVADTGCGIPEDDIEKLFDPFFSRKFTGRGMGLAVVLGLVRTHSGVVTVESRPGQGSTFRIFFPCLPAIPGD